MWIMMALFWVAVAFFLIWAVRGFPARRRASAHDARAILDGRLAAGEITMTEYEAMRSALEHRVVGVATAIDPDEHAGIT